MATPDPITEAGTISLANSGVTPGTYGDSSHVAQVTVDAHGLLSAASDVAVTPATIGAVPTSRTITASTGLTGGGDLSADRTISLSTPVSQTNGGTGLDTSAVTDGQLLIGQTSDHTFGLATISGGSGVTITNSGHGISISATGSGGTVTSVGLSMPAEFSVSGSPVTGSGTLTVTKANETANTVFSGPSTGAAAAPTFRSLVIADLPGSIPNANLANSSLTVTAGTGLSGGGAVSLGGSTTISLTHPVTLANGGIGIDGSGVTDGQILIGKTSDHSLNLATISAGSGVSITNGAGSVTIAATGSGGTVTSVGLSTNSDILTVGSSPVTTSGTITLNKTTGLAANQVVATPDGTTGTASLRALVAADIPNLAASKITSGQLALARGGTALDTSGVTDGQILIGQTSDHTFGLATISGGSGITVTNAGHSISIAATGGGGGTVTSVGLSTNSDILTVGSSPVTSSGTITLNRTTGLAANQVVATPDGTTGTASLRALVAADIPNLAASKITSGQVPLARGGTGKDTSGVTDGQLLIGKTSDNSLNLAALTAGVGITIANGAAAITVAAQEGIQRNWMGF